MMKINKEQFEAARQGKSKNPFINFYLKNEENPTIKGFEKFYDSLILPVSSKILKERSKNAKSEDWKSFITKEEQEYRIEFFGKLGKIVKEY